MQRNFFFLLICALSLLIFSCSRENNTPAPATPVDTLSAGWKKILFNIDVNLIDIVFVNNQKGFVCGQNYLASTSDGGETWTKYNLPDSLNQNFVNLYFLDVNHGWIAGEKHLLYTIDGGTNWKVASSGPTFDVQFFDANTGYITRDETGGLYKTVDAGKTRTLVAPQLQGFSDLHFFNQNAGFIIGREGVFQTTNGGATITKTSLAEETRNYIIEFTDTQHGWIGGLGGTWSTVNGGLSWEKILANDGGDVHFFDNNNGYISGQTQLFKTTDGGKTKTRVCKIVKGSFTEIFFTDANHGWACGGSGVLLKYLKP